LVASSSDRDLLATINRRVFRAVQFAIAPCLIVAFGAIRSEHPPSLLELGAGLVEAFGGAAALLTGLATGIKSAGPLPPRYRVRRADGALNVPT
jgi:hypothetical protein